jgi:hypothetical protein
MADARYEGHYAAAPVHHAFWRCSGRLAARGAALFKSTDDCAVLAQLQTRPMHSVRTKALRSAWPLTVHNHPICATAALVVFLAASFGCSVGIAAESKQVLLLHSFGRDFKPWSEYAKSIRMELNQQSPWPLDITEHSLVTARSPDEDSDIAFVEYLRALSAKRSPDIIVSIGAPAAAFVQRHRPQLFAASPMVFTAVEQRRVQYSSLTANDAVVAVRINYLAAVENILQVLPDTENVMVVVGTSPIEKFWKEAIGKELEPLTDRIKISWTDDLSFEALLKRASSLPPHSAIFWELMIVDAAGVVHEGDVPLTRLHAVANAPIFSYDESFFGNEIVGGPLLLDADSGRETAAVAIRMLGGEKSSEIRTPVVQFASPIFDWRQMQRWGISEKNLPPGSKILFRVPAAWEQYHWQILTACAVFLIQIALIGWLIYEHRRRHLAEVQARNSNHLWHRSRSAIEPSLRFDSPENGNNAADTRRFSACWAEEPSNLGHRDSLPDARSPLMARFSAAS